ncbi:hypothetical protein OHC33_004019 [Knufia fluminis]|uniref:Cytochrome b561 domain-containing protein n=1 Tax=Knufia fluminis TaxID=191047 RepID=A0AAN8I5D3_9EURO|nr:hypothetical protein OHC33_004019 [Knufia fluminis]
MLSSASHGSASETPNLPARQITAPSFTGTADAIDSYDPHDYVPTHYSKTRIAHAVTMSVTWLLIFPLGGIIPRVMSDRRLVWVHAIMQMVGFWLTVGAAGMGIWMAKEIKQLNKYHPVIGLMLLGLLALQPATEILNHKFYARHPRMIITAHIHLWLGRGLLIAGAVQGGLGFLFASSFHNAVADVWPRVLYAATAITVWAIYILVGILYPEFKGSIKSKIKQGQHAHGNRKEVLPAGEMEELRVPSVGMVGGHGHARGQSSAPLMAPGTPATPGGFGAWPNQSQGGNASVYNGYSGSVSGYTGSTYPGSVSGYTGSTYVGDGYQRSTYEGSMYQGR